MNMYRRTFGFGSQANASMRPRDNYVIIINEGQDAGSLDKKGKRLTPSRSFFELS